MRVEATAARAARARIRRQKVSARRLAARRVLAAVALVAAAGLVVGVVFAGSPATLASGVHVAGVDVGGLSAGDAQRLLERRAERLSRVPVVFTVGSRSWRITPRGLGLEVNWAAAIDSARRQGDGFRPVRGLRRLGISVFGTDIAPPTRVYEAALRYRLDILARDVRRPHREAAVRLRGLNPEIVPARSGRLLDRASAAPILVRALASLNRSPVALPVVVDKPKVTSDDLKTALAQTRTAVSAPVRLRLGTTRWRIPRWRVAGLLALPGNGTRSLSIGGPGADRYLGRLARHVDRAPLNAGFRIHPGGISVVPSRSGVSVDVLATSKALLAAALSPTSRTAAVTVRTEAPKRTTAEAKAMGIKGLVGGYTTTYGGEPNRIHNVQLVSRLIDNTLIAPGATFSFNQTTGERTADKGFREAPVIINGELQTGLGGGVCQVSTTVFNAAYEAGLGIAERTNHALYIDHYPLGRDATVNYPDLDLRFVNDTPRWLLLRTFVGSSSLTVNLYGTPVGRRVETETAPLVTEGPVPEETIADPNLFVGESVTEEYGEPPRSTSVARTVYNRRGRLLHENSWQSYYRGEPTVVRVGTKPRPAPPPPPPATTKEKDEPPPATTTAPTGTAPATTTAPPPPSPPPPAAGDGELPTPLP